jgi:hypothetical protein
MPHGKCFAPTLVDQDRTSEGHRLAATNCHADFHRSLSSLLHEFYHGRDHSRSLPKDIAYNAQQPERFAHGLCVFETEWQNHIRFWRTLEHSLAFFVETAFDRVMFVEYGNESRHGRIRIHQSRLSLLSDVWALAL